VPRQVLKAEVPIERFGGTVLAFHDNTGHRQYGAGTRDFLTCIGEWYRVKALPLKVFIDCKAPD